MNKNQKWNLLYSKLVMMQMIMIFSNRIINYTYTFNHKHKQFFLNPIN